MSTTRVRLLDVETRAKAINSLRDLDGAVTDFLRVDTGNQSVRQNFADINAITPNSRKILEHYAEYNKDIQSKIAQYTSATNTNLVSASSPYFSMEAADSHFQVRLL